MKTQNSKYVLSLNLIRINCILNYLSKTENQNKTNFIAGITFLEFQFASV
jgi:hypothetical protein